MDSPASNLRRPLATKTNTASRLPTLGSRLKRQRSPTGEEAVSGSGGKKQKSSGDDTKNQNSAPKKSLRPSLSTSNLPKTGPRQRLPAVEASKQRLKRANSAISKNAAIPSATPGPDSFRFRAPQQKNTTSTALRSRAPQSTMVAPKTVAVVPKTRAAATTVSRNPSTVNRNPNTINRNPNSRSDANNLDSTVVSTGGPKKRPGWDLKGRLQDMEDMMRREQGAKSSLKNQLSEYNDRIAQLESHNQQLSGDVVAKEMASETAIRQINQLKEQLANEEQEFNLKKRKLESQIEELQFQKASLERQKSSLEGELTASLQEVNVLKTSVADLTASQASIRAQLDNTKIQLDSANSVISSLNEAVNSRDSRISQQSEKISDLEQKERSHETERRRLHNTIQELKGNIRVYCRVRPLLGAERLSTDGEIPHICFPDMDGKVLELDKLSDMPANEKPSLYKCLSRSMLNSTRGQKPGSKYSFTFDKVFEPETTQAEVFEEISQLVQSALDGYNVCIFAYGQTGSGKTHTMEGSLASEDTLGMIPRSVRQIFHSATDLAAKGWKYTLKASMLEIYNETILDLLSTKDKQKKLDIRMNGKGETGDVHVKDLTVVEVTSEQKVLDLLRQSTEARTVAETKCNSRSSRSHSVFQMELTGSNSLTGESCKGTLSLVDLAGSERVKESGSEGQQLEEAKKINKSLSHLGNVIMALGNKDKHVPYRDSKLTYLLQNSLGGNSKTLMFVNVSPKEECFSESLSSLRFATKVNQCNIGTAQKKN